MRRRDLLTGTAALGAYAALQQSAQSFGIGKLGADFGGLGSLGGAGKFIPPQLPILKAAIAQQKAGIANVRMLFLGNSTAMGFGGAANGIDNGAFPWSYPSQLAPLISGTSTQSRVGTNAQSSDSYDTRIVRGAGWVLPSGLPALGATFFKAPSGITTSLSFTPTIQTDTLDIFYIINPGGGTFKVDVGGASLGTTPTSATAAYGKVTYTAPKGANTWNITPTTAGDIYIGIVNAHDSTGPKTIDILNAGWSGALINNFVSDTTSPWGPLLSLPSIGTAYIGIDLTVNDAIAQTPIPTFSSKHQTLITASKSAGADVMLISGDQPNPTSAPTYAAYVAAYDALAASNGIYHLNVSKILGGYSTFLANNWLSDTVVHPNGNQGPVVPNGGKGGYGAIAGLVRQALASAL